MNPTETASNEPQTEVHKASIPRHLQYHRVLDGRKQPIRGLLERNGRYYGRMTVTDLNTGIKTKGKKIPLVIKNDAGVEVPVQTVAEAVAALKRLHTQRADNDLPVLRQTPKFNDFADAYLTSATTLNKGVKTVQTEKTHINSWKKHLGETRLNLILKPMIMTVRDKMLTEPSEHTGRQNTARTVNLAMTCLRNVLNKALDDGWIQRLPTDGIKPLQVVTPKKRLVPMEHMKKICEGATESKNAVQFNDLILFLCYCGGRISETLRLKWQDVDWTERHLTIGYDGRVKNYKSRVVDFNEKLEAHLKDMFSRRAPDTDFIFPSPQRGKNSKPAKTFRQTLNLARTKAGLPKFGFHDCRHFFASMCAMSDVAKDVVRDWMGHSTTKLLDDVYVHYCRDYHKNQSAKVRFEPIVSTPIA